MARTITYLRLIDLDVIFLPTWPPRHRLVTFIGIYLVFRPDKTRARLLAAAAFGPESCKQPGRCGAAVFAGY